VRKRRESNSRGLKTKREGGEDTTVFWYIGYKKETCVEGTCGQRLEGNRARPGRDNLRKQDIRGEVHNGGEGEKVRVAKYMGLALAGLMKYYEARFNALEGSKRVVEFKLGEKAFLVLWWNRKKEGTGGSGGFKGYRKRCPQGYVISRTKIN